jgi:hypothetical protein
MEQTGYRCARLVNRNGKQQQALLLRIKQVAND